VLKSKLTNVGTGEKPQAESPPQAGEATGEKAKMEAEEEGVGAEKSAEATPGKDFRATVEDVEEEEQAYDPGEQGQTPLPAPHWPPNAAPAPPKSRDSASNSASDAGFDLVLPDLVEDNPYHLARFEHISDHPDVRARAVYFINRAFVAAPGSSVQLTHAAVVYQLAFKRPGTEPPPTMLDSLQSRNPLSFSSTSSPAPFSPPAAGGSGVGGSAGGVAHPLLIAARFHARSNSLTASSLDFDLLFTGEEPSVLEVRELTSALSRASAYRWTRRRKLFVVPKVMKRRMSMRWASRAV